MCQAVREYYREFGLIHNQIKINNIFQRKNIQIHFYLGLPNLDGINPIFGQNF